MCKTEVEELIETINSLTKIYDFRNNTEVSLFIESNPFLVQLLRQAHAKIRQTFGDSKPIVLEVIKDYDSEDGDELFALVQTNLPPQEARSKLKRLDREWWSEASRQAKCQMNIDIEYV